MKPNDFEQMLQQWTPKEVSPRIGRRLFGRDASADRRWCPLWVAPVATACFALALSVGGVRRETDGRWEGQALFQTIGNEILTVRDPVKLAEAAAARKPTMLLLPYGIPMAVGSIAFFAWAGLLF